MLKKLTSILLAGAMALPLAMVPAFAETVYESQPAQEQDAVVETFDYPMGNADPDWYLAGQEMDFSQGDLRNASGSFHYYFNNKEILGGKRGAYKVEMDVTAPLGADTNKYMSAFVSVRLNHFTQWAGIAQPGIEQIAKEQLGADQGIAEINNAEDADGSAHDAGETEIFFVTEKTAYTK